MIHPLLFVSLILIGFAAIFFFISWSIHRSMTVDEGPQWGYGTYRQFLVQYDRQDWEDVSKWGNWSDSLFCHETGSKIHASIIKFNGKGMVLTPRAWLHFLIFVVPAIKRHNQGNRIKVDWSE